MRSNKIEGKTKTLSESETDMLLYDYGRNIENLFGAQ